jgi:hypothetical protein
VATPPENRLPKPRPLRPRTARPAPAARQARSPRPAGSTLAFHASRIVIDIGVLLVLASMSLSYVTAPTGDRSAMHLDALPVLLLVAPIFAITLIPDHTRPVPRPLAWASLVLGLAAFPYAVVKYLDARVLAATLGGGLGSGVRLLVFGNFVVIVGIAIGLTRAWLGLASGGSPSRIAAAPLRSEAAAEARTPAPPTRDAASPPLRSRPARAGNEQSPFGEPLFDSLEVPATGTQPPLRQPGVIFEAGGAAERVAEDAGDEPRSDPG